MGLLVEATNNPKKDREIFLKLLTMDDEGLWQRKSRLIPPKDIYSRATPRERKEWFDTESTETKPKYKKDFSANQKDAIQKTIFMRLSYDEKLTYCDRPEQFEGLSEKSWAEINAQLGTNVKNISELVQELGKRRFGHIPRVGDAFCGGGSIPFEAARIGCDAYGSDLNPVGTLLTWASFNIIGGAMRLLNKFRQIRKKSMLQ